jgi:hypothetical protein
MTPLFMKLNLKAQNPILIGSAPASFEPEATAVRAFTTVHTAAQPGVTYTFVLSFALSRAELTQQAAELVRQSTPEAILWFAYPKQTSKAYKSDLNRDRCREVLADFGLEPNRQIAIDDDWSALRFKKV